MRSLGKGLCLAAVLTLCLLAAGCGTARADAGDPEDAVPVTVLDYAAFPDLGGVETVSVSAGFLTEDGEPLSEGTVRLRVGETGADFPLDSGGELRVSGLPRQGTVELTLQENVEVPLMYAGVPKPERHERSELALEMVGLGDKLKHKPMQLSGGQQQRVSIARALAGDPAVILADEPTGALDSHTGREVLTMLQQLHAAGNTVVLITHDNSIAVQAQRIIRLEDGHVIYDGDASAPEAVVTPNLAGRGAAG